ncbi:MAG: ComF family protein [Acidobacteriota bacterium]
MLSTVLPASCKLCLNPLDNFSTIPVCQKCLHSVVPLESVFACAGCRTPFLNPSPLDENGMCLLCSSGINRFEAAYSYGVYEGELRELIHLFKFQRIESLAKPLGRLLLRSLPPSEAFDAIVPVPLHWRRRFSRGFNQAQLLARVLGQSLHIPVRMALRRARSTDTQSSLTGIARRRNVRGAFQIRSSPHIAGASLLLVDDVFTTGATANACAMELKAAGARRVTVLTIARADRRQWMQSLLEPAESPHKQFAKGAQ